MAEERAEQLAIVEQQMKQHADKRAQLNTEQAQRKQIDDTVQAEKDKFMKMVKDAHDLGDHMQDLLDHMKKFTNASAVYIGQLVAPKKPITDGDDDSAHIDDASEKIIHFTHADEAHKFLVDQVLPKGNGLTFDVFTDKVDEEGKKIEQEDLDHILIKEVVREPRMHFFKVPRLGSYMAIRLEYDSCLFVEAYNAAIADAMSMKERKKDQEEMRREHEDKEKDRKEECEANDTEYVRDEGNWPDVKPKPFQTHKVQYVLCLNTLGQDREFTPEEIRFALECAKNYRDEWQRIEKDNLTRDIDRKMDNMDASKQYREVNEAIDIAESEKRAEEATMMQDGNEPMDEFQKGQAVKKAKWDLLTKMFYDPEGASQHAKLQDRERARTNTSGDRDRSGTPNTSAIGDPVDEKYVPLVPEYWKQPFLDMKDLNVLKMPRVLQSLFYLLGFSREEVCERDTNKLDLKKAKTLINEDLFEKMAKFNPVGQSEKEYKIYQKLSFVKKNIESVEEEKVDEYSVILGRIHRWVTQALDLRIEDVRSRRDNIATLKFEREQALSEDTQRTEKREAALEEKKAVSSS